MVAECVKGFRDLDEQKDRKVGERFEVTKERFLAINGTKYGQLVREVRQRKPKED